MSNNPNGMSKQSVTNKLSEHNITIIGKYVNATVKTKLKCFGCNAVWHDSPITAIRYGCQNCR